jgi:hypothetical protein
MGTPARHPMTRGQTFPITNSNKMRGRDNNKASGMFREELTLSNDPIRNIGMQINQKTKRDHKRMELEAGVLRAGK